MTTDPGEPVRSRLQGLARRFFSPQLGPADALADAEIPRRQLWRGKITATLLVGLVVYTIVWSIISVLKFYAFNAQVYDLGITMTELWQITHNSWSPLYFTYVSLLEGIRLPLFWLPYLGYPFALVFQTVFIAAGIFPLYGIARLSGLGERTSLMLSLTYLVYFGLFGLNWYDLHVEAFFPTLFLGGYFLLLRKHYLFSGVLFVLSGLTRYPFMGFVLLLAFVLLVEQAYAVWRNRPGLPSNLVRFAAVLFGITLAYFAAFQVIAPAATLGPTFQTHYLGGDPFDSLPLKLITVALILVPISLLLPYARRWPVFLAPFLIYLFVANYYVFYYPTLMIAQYGVLFTPFVYLVAIEGLSRLQRRSVAPAKEPSPHPPNRPRRRWTLHRPTPRTSFGAVVLSVVALALVFEPFSPLNQFSGANYDLPQNVDVNWTLYDEFTHLASYVPASDPYVVIQEDMPMLLPRALPYGTAMVPTIANFTLNSSRTGFLIRDTNNNTWVNARIDYLVADPYQVQYYYYANASMYDMISTLYRLDEAGFVAEASGFMLLESGYVGPLLYYVPFQSSMSATSFQTGNLGTRVPGGSIEVSNPNATQNNLGWSGYLPFLAPGNYSFTFDLKTSTLNSGNSVIIGNVLNSAWVVTSKDFAQTGTWTQVTEVADVTSPIVISPLYTWVIGWNGTLTFGGLTVRQTSPPAPA
jgi:uncharacterized membrane protein